MATPNPSRDMHPWLAALRVYMQKRILIVGALGFASGLPLLLTLSTLTAWLFEARVDRTTIGLFAAVGIPYTFKFAWAPLVDRLPLPGLTRALGRRRAWGVASQLALAAAIVWLGASDPISAPGATALAAVCVASLSATQDIVIDAYRTELLEDHEQGAGAAMAVLGYRLGMLVSGAGALYLAAATGWFEVFVAMAVVLILVGTVTFLLAPEPDAPEEPESAEVSEWFRSAVVAPFTDFAKRRSWLLVLVFLAVFKLGDATASAMSMPFYLDLEFTKPQIASITKVFGLAATLVGSFVGGLLVARMGILKSLVVTGVLQMVSNLGFTVLALLGNRLDALTAVIAFENLASGMGAAALVAYLASLCNLRFSATQFALLSSLASIGRTVMSTPSGYVSELVGWAWFFAATTAMAVPGLLLLWWIMRTRAGAPPLPVSDDPGTAPPADGPIADDLHPRVANAAVPA